MAAFLEHQLGIPKKAACKALDLPEEKEKGTLDKLVDFMAEKMMNDQNSQLMRQAAIGFIDKIKQKGFYVDLDKDGNVLSDPSLISREEADKWMAHARRAISRSPEQISESYGSRSR